MTQSSFSAAFLEKYTLGRVLGEGAFGVVYEAHNTFLRKAVAIKALKPEGAAQLERFQREAAVLAALDHPRILRVFDAGVDAGRTPYLVTELVPGQTLEALIEQGPLELGRAVEVLAGIGEALAFAHAKGVIHRDVKPANVFVTPDGVKLGDFGLARDIEGASFTEAGTMLGTPHYLSPEAAKGQEVGPAADQYALGVIAYELFSGRRPFSGRNAVEIIVARLDGAPAPLGEVPDALARVVMRALAREPAERFPDVAGMVAELQQAARPGGRVKSGRITAPRAAGEPGTATVAAPRSRPSGRIARPPSVTERAVPVVPEEPAGVPVAALAAAALLVLAIGGGLAVRASRNRSPAKPLVASVAAPPGQPKVLLEEDFDRGLARWTLDPKQYHAKDGALERHLRHFEDRVTAKGWALIEPKPDEPLLADYVLTVQFHAARRLSALLFNVQDDRSCDMLVLDQREGRGWRHARGGAPNRAGVVEEREYETGRFSFARGRWYDLELVQRAGEVRFSIDGQQLALFPAAYRSGGVGVYLQQANKIRALKIQELPPELAARPLIPPKPRTVAPPPASAPATAPAVTPRASSPPPPVEASAPQDPNTPEGGENPMAPKFRGMTQTSQIYHGPGRFECNACHATYRASQEGRRCANCGIQMIVTFAQNGARIRDLAGHEARRTASAAPATPSPSPSASSEVDGGRLVLAGGVEIVIPEGGWGKRYRSEQMGTRKGCKVRDDAFLTGARKNRLQIWVLENTDHVSLDVFAEPRSTFMTPLVRREKRRTVNNLDAYAQVDVCDPPYNDLVYECEAMIEVDRDTFVELGLTCYVGTSQEAMTALWDALVNSVNAAR